MFFLYEISDVILKKNNNEHLYVELGFKYKNIKDLFLYTFSISEEDKSVNYSLEKIEDTFEKNFSFLKSAFRSKGFSENALIKKEMFSNVLDFINSIDFWSVYYFNLKKVHSEILCKNLDELLYDSDESTTDINFFERNNEKYFKIKTDYKNSGLIFLINFSSQVENIFSDQIDFFYEEQNTNYVLTFSYPYNDILDQQFLNFKLKCLSHKKIRLKKLLN